MQSRSINDMDANINSADVANSKLSYMEAFCLALRMCGNPLTAHETVMRFYQKHPDIALQVPASPMASRL